MLMVAAGLYPLTAAEPSVSSHQQAAVELMEVMHVDRTVQNGLDIMIKAQLQANPQLAPYEDLLRGFLSKYLAWEVLRQDYAQLYVDAYTEPELKELTAFYRSAIGQKVIVSLPEIMRKGAALGQSKVTDHLDELKELVAKRAQELESQKQTN
jgi:uncharacterized protein